jgi:hypothetical protein
MHAPAATTTPAPANKAWAVVPCFPARREQLRQIAQHRTEAQKMVHNAFVQVGARGPGGADLEP